MIQTCAHEACGKAFEAKRADARFCSAGCRAAASRARRTGSEAHAEPFALPSAAAADPEMASRLNALEARVEALAARFEQVPAAVTAPVSDPALAVRIQGVEARVEALAARLIEGQAKAARELAAVARELGHDRDATNERVADVIERVDALEPAARAKPERQGTDSRRMETRLAEIDEALRKLKRKLAEQGARITALDESAAAVVNLLTETE